MRPHDGLHERQSETVAFGTVRGIALVELVEDVALCFRRHALAFVGDGHLGAAVREGVQAHVDDATVDAEFDCIFQKIDPNLHQHCFTTGIPHPIELHVELDFLLRPARLQQQQGLADLLIERKMLHCVRI